VVADAAVVDDNNGAVVEGGLTVLDGPGWRVVGDGVVPGPEPPGGEAITSSASAR
jgi:hypothetical protein